MLPLPRLRISPEILLPPLLIAMLLSAMPWIGKARAAAPSPADRQVTAYMQFAASHGDAAAIAAYADALAARRDGGALLKLAEVLSKGSAAERALVAPVYEKAGESGRDVAWVMLAQIHARGAGVPPDPLKAAGYYRRAIAAGRPDAMFGLGKALAQRTLGRAGTVSEGLALLREAEKKGYAEATAVLAECRIMGTGVPRDVGEGLTALREAWKGGNTAAALQLVAFYRDGRSGLIARNRFLAEYYFRKVEPGLDPNEAAVQRLLLDASAPGKRGDYAAIARSLGEIAGSKRRMVVRKMRVLNPNAYVFVIQSRLRELGVFAGRPDGRLSRRTMVAMQRYCRGVAGHEACRKGPMSGSASEAFSLAF
jgi:hypothetical protein